MAEMPKHEAGDAVFVREEQHQMPYSAKVHDLPTNLSFVEITKDADGTIKKVEHYKVIPQKENMSVLVSGDNKTNRHARRGARGLLGGLTEQRLVD